MDLQLADVVNVAAIQHEHSLGIPYVFVLPFGVYVAGSGGAGEEHDAHENQRGDPQDANGCVYQKHRCVSTTTSFRAEDPTRRKR